MWEESTWAFNLSPCYAVSSLHWSNTLVEYLFWFKLYLSIDNFTLHEDYGTVSDPLFCKHSVEKIHAI